MKKHCESWSLCSVTLFHCLVICPFLCDHCPIVEIRECLFSIAIHVQKSLNLFFSQSVSLLLLSSNLHHSSPVKRVLLCFVTQTRVSVSMSSDLFCFAIPNVMFLHICFVLTYIFPLFVDILKTIVRQMIHEMRTRILFYIFVFIHFLISLKTLSKMSKWVLMFKLNPCKTQCSNHFCVCF